jgi:hypothetical protein
LEKTFTETVTDRGSVPPGAGCSMAPKAMAPPVWGDIDSSSRGRIVAVTGTLLESDSARVVVGLE